MTRIPVLRTTYSDPKHPATIVVKYVAHVPDEHIIYTITAKLTLYSSDVEAVVNAPDGTVIRMLPPAAAMALFDKLEDEAAHADANGTSVDITPTE